MSIRLLAPVQPAHLAEILRDIRKVLVIEQNHSGQLHRYLRAEYDLPGEVTALHRPGALQFNPAEIHRQLIEWSRA